MSRYYLVEPQIKPEGGIHQVVTNIIEWNGVDTYNVPSGSKLVVVNNTDLNIGDVYSA